MGQYVNFETELMCMRSPENIYYNLLEVFKELEYVYDLCEAKNGP